MDWIDIIQRLGLPIAILIALAWFGYKKVWPIIEKKITEGEAERQKYLASLDKLAQGRDVERKEVQETLNQQREARYEERTKFLEVIENQSETNKSNNEAIVNAVKELTQQITKLHDRASINQREILKTIGELNLKAKTNGSDT